MNTEFAIEADTERCGPYSLVQFEIPTEDGLTLSIHRVESRAIEHRAPIVLVHGSYTNRRFWLSPKGKGLAGFLCDRGHDVWILETRGHGFSQNPAAFRSMVAEDVIRYDFAAAQRAIASKVPSPQIWIGHSYGGLYLLGALSMGYLRQDGIAACATFGAQISRGQEYLRRVPLVARALKGLTSALGRFPAVRLGMGSEDEPPGIMRQALDWKSSGRWSGQDGAEFSRGFAAIRVPVLTVAGGGDRIDPAEGCEELHRALGSKDKRFLLLSKRHGFRADYGHTDMILGSSAQAEVWPKLLEWLRSLDGAQAAVNPP